LTFSNVSNIEIAGEEDVCPMIFSGPFGHRRWIYRRRQNPAFDQRLGGTNELLE
jgi:hypothetical protein